MAKCIGCGVETLLFVLGQPVCVKCDEEQEEEQRKKEECSNTRSHAARVAVNQTAAPAGESEKTDPNWLGRFVPGG
jgi:hypothetical protein